MVGCVSTVADTKADKTSLWHLRLGHISETDLKKISEKGCFEKDHIYTLPFCEKCTLGNSNKVSFPKIVVHRTAYVRMCTF